jgi:tRNA pseudouridine55 synthase
MMSNDSLMLIDKPYGYSSARVVNIIKKALNIRKAGHAGTLDPKATGLLIIGTGIKTKELHNFLNCSKEYTGVMTIGAKTRSFDLETEVYDSISVDHISDELIMQTAEKLTGVIEQYPPMFSAAKHKGKPLYKFARKNINIEREARKVTIDEFLITEINKPDINFRISCSKGTYIRTLVDDFGSLLATGAYLKELRRTAIGNLRVENAVTLQSFKDKYNFEEKIRERIGNIPQD